MKKKKKNTKKKEDGVNFRVYGIIDFKKRKMVKVGLNKTEIEMEIALMGDISENLVQCDFDVKLSI